MAETLRTISAYTRVVAKNTLVYRGMVIVWMIGWLLAFLTMVFLWRAADTTGPIGGFTQNQLVTYYFLGVLIRATCGWYAFDQAARKIKDGTVVNFIVKPADFHWFGFASELAWHLVSTAFYGITLAFVYFFVRQYLVLGITPLQGLWFLLGIVVTALVTFEFNMALATGAFWLTHYTGLGSFYWFLLILFGGQVVPLAFFPATIQPVVKLLPFRFMYSFPLEIYLGRLAGPDLVMAFGAGLAWIAGLYLLYRFLFNRGIKIYTGFGQ